MHGDHCKILSEPACQAGCVPCLRRCALARIKLGWWEKEEARLLLAGAPPREPARNAWLSQLEEAAERLQRLRRDTRPSAPSWHGAACPEGRQGARRAILLH